MQDSHIHEFTGPICVLGLGHVGLTLSLGLADVGFTVFGYDVKESVRTDTRAKVAHFKEKNLPELLEQHVGINFFVVDDLKDVPRKEGESVAYMVTVGTPFQFDNTPDYTYLEGAADMLGKVVKNGDLVILRSTVPLGTTREFVIPRLEASSGLRAGTDLFVAFAPERTVEGNAFEELRTLPQIVGGFDEVSRNLAASIYGKLAETLVLLDSLEEAEIVKLINNTYRETIFAFSNQVSMLARAWGLDTKKVITAANEGYSRSKVPFPSPGVGGYCLTKDSYLFRESARKKSVDTQLLSAVRENSSTMLDVIARDIRTYVKERVKNKTAVIGILGFAFKGVPATSDVRGSTTHALIKRFNFERNRYHFVGYDPNVKPAVIEGMNAEPKNSIEEVVRESDMVIIMNNDPTFAQTKPEFFDGKEHCILFDTWGVCDRSTFGNQKSVSYWTL